jgi:uracil-DNA glycosylase
MTDHSNASRSDMLRAMGISEWRLRSYSPGSEPIETLAAELATVSSSPQTARSESENPSASKPSTPGPVLNPPQAQTLELAAAPQVPVERAVASATSWNDLIPLISACAACPRHTDRTRAVVGAGSQSATCLIVGEAPSPADDAAGEPFADQGGVLLTDMLAAIGLDRSQVYITHMTKCMAAEQRPPEAAEVHSCAAHLEAQIALVRPSLILALGLTAGRYLTGTDTDISVTALRGQVHRHASMDTPLVVTYHPRYLLKRPSEKARAWEDLQLAQRTLSGPPE